MATKLLLIEDVEHLGRSGDVVTVRPGYARNLLLPKGVAVPADKRTLRMQARLQEERQKKALLDKAEAEKTAAELVTITLTTTVKVDPEGHMYGSVSAHDIAELLQQQSGIALEKRLITLKHPLKVTGVHTIPVKLKEGVAATITLKILAEGAVEELPTEEPVEQAE